MYNAHEAGLSTVQKSERILVTTGREQVGVITSTERGETPLFIVVLMLIFLKNTIMKN